MRSPVDALAQPSAYLEQLDRLRRRQRRGDRQDRLTYRDVSLVDIAGDDRKLAGLLARAVRRGEYRLGSVIAYPARIEGKERTLYRSNLLDTIVLGVLARALGELLESVIATEVYSYRVGRSSWEALSDLRRYLDEHRRARRDPRERGLYVVHRDIRSYGARIPTDDSSVLWAELRRALTRAGVSDDHFLWPLLRGAIRPEVEGMGAPSTVGVPTGSAVQPALCNLYLSSVDRLTRDVDGGFYARFGDDMLYCHHDDNHAREMARRIDAQIAVLRLEVKQEKRRDLYLTGAGRRSGAWPDARGATQFDYLGMRIDLRGTMGLKPEKTRRFLREMRRRARGARQLCETTETRRRPPSQPLAATVCRALARALDPSNPLCDPAAGMLRHIVSDRRQLKQLDHAVALAVAEVLAGQRGPRAFRHVPYHSLRKLGLPSLVVERNAVGYRRWAPT